MPSDHDSDAREAGKATGEPRVSDAPGTPTNTPLDVVKPLVFADNDGWRHAVLDTEWMAWVCPHVHATAQEAESCRETDGRVPTKVPEGLTLEEVQDFLSIPCTEDGLQEGELEVWMVGPPAAAAPRSTRRRAGRRREGRRTRKRSPRPA